MLASVRLPMPGTRDDDARALIAEDEPLLLQRLQRRAALRCGRNCRVIATVGDGDSALRGGACSSDPTCAFSTSACPG